MRQQNNCVLSVNAPSEANYKIPLIFTVDYVIRKDMESKSSIESLYVNIYRFNALKHLLQVIDCFIK